MHYFQREDGNLSIIASVVGLLLATTIGATLDAGRMMGTQSNLQSIADAAALMAMSPEGISDEERQRLAAVSVENNLKNHSDVDLIFQAFTLSSDGRQLYVSLRADVPMLFGSLLGSEKRGVRANATAEESLTSDADPISVSVVLDLSDSMGEAFDRGTKASTVKKSLSEFLGVASSQLGDAGFSSGVYGFNWGEVGSETISLEPGSAKVMLTLQNLTLGEGSVPSRSMENALADQIKDKDETGGRNRFIAYISDGGVDNEKSDQKGRLLPINRALSPESAPECSGNIQRVDLAREKLAQHYNRINAKSPTIGLVSLVMRTSATLIDDVEKLLGVHSGAGNGKPTASIQALINWKEIHDDALTDVDDSCVFVQTKRVIDACETARVEEDISVIAINIGGKDEETETVMRQCTATVLDDAESATQVRAQAEVNPNDPKPKKKRLTRGLEVTVSADGQSTYATVQNLNELRDVLATMLPNGDVSRRVRLVG